MLLFLIVTMKMTCYCNIFLIYCYGDEVGVVIGVETFRAKFIVNCAGGYSDKIAHMIGDNSFKIKPRLGKINVLVSRVELLS